jgi:endonuclease G, mitochondrial
MAPQVPAHNQQIWRELEDQVRRWMIVRHSGYIITGGMFYDPKEEDAATATGVVRHKTIGSGVAVPTHFYKIAVAKDSSGEWQAIGFVMENRTYKRPFHFADSIKAIDWIEQRTGLDFTPELGPADEKRLERTAAPIWN